MAGARRLCVADLEEDVGFIEAFPGVGGDEMEVDEVEFLTVEAVAGVGVGNVDDVAINVFVHHKPRTASEAKALALADGVEPIALVLTYDVACFALDNGSLTGTEEGADIVGIVDLTQETDALAVATVGGGEMMALGELTHFVFEEMADGETEFTGLDIGELGEEVGLVLDGIGGRGQPELSGRVAIGLGIVARGDIVIGMAGLFVEGSELDETIAHHVGIGGETSTYAVDDVGRHAVVVFLLEVDDFKMETITACGGRGEFNIFFGGAGSTFALHADLDIEKVWADALLTKEMTGHGAVYAAGD